MKNRFFISDADKWLISDYAVEDTYDIIYIDPPYNTATKLSYNDSRDDWWDFMWGKLSRARILMKDDGVIFISIDDRKLIELCQMCDKIFGKKNRIAIMVTRQSPRSNSKLVNIVHEYVVTYAKDKTKVPEMSISRFDTDEGPELRDMMDAVKKEYDKNGRDAAEALLRKKKASFKRNHPPSSWIDNYRCVDEAGEIVFPRDVSLPGVPNRVVLEEYGLVLEPLERRKWTSADTLRKFFEEDLIIMIDGRPHKKIYLRDVRDSMQSLLPFMSRQGTEELKKLGVNGVFDTPKPPKMIETLCASLLGDKQQIRVLDFFGGCGTTARACFALNQRYDGYRFAFDIVQIDEPLREGSEAYKKSVKLGIVPTIPDVMRAVTNAWIDANVRSDEATLDGRYGFDWIVIN